MAPVFYQQLKVYDRFNGLFDDQTNI